MNVKQTIVVRKDLKMRKGKIAAQVAHASMKVFFDRMNKRYDLKGNHISYELPHENITPEIIEWKEGIFTKIVLSCDSEEAILALQKKATELGIPHAVIIDCGKTEFHGVPTITCIAIGPDKAALVESITEKFNLL